MASSRIVAIADPVKPSTPDALKALVADGIKVIMLTGDNRTTANAVAEPRIADVEAEVLPDQERGDRKTAKADGSSRWPVTA